MLNQMILFRVNDEIRNSIISQSKKESKSIAAYLRDIHQQHCMKELVIECPHCRSLNMRIKQKCETCRKEY